MAFRLLILISSVASTVVKENVRSSSECKLDCVDQNRNFCPTNAQFTKGTCCTDDTCKDKVDICSDEASSMTEMQYQACPKEPWCGDYFLTPPKDGSLLEIRPGGDSEYIFFLGSMCTYMISFPDGASLKDKLQVTMHSSFRAEASFMVTQSYGSN